MRIAIIAPSAIPARRANTIQVMKMAQALVSLGHDVRMAAPAPSQANNKSNLPGKEIHNFRDRDWLDLAHHYGIVNQFPIRFFLARPIFRRYDYSLSAFRWARKWGADLVYTRLPQAGALSAISGLPTILEIHDIPQGLTGPLLFRAFLRGSGAVRLVCITSALAQDIQTRFRKGAVSSRLVIAPDGVDLERYRDLPSPETSRALISQRLASTSSRNLERFTAGYTGHLYAGRGIDFILELAGRLPEMDFLLVGGEPREILELQSLITEKKLENIILAGFVPNADLPLFQSACDVLLMPYQDRVAASSGGDISRYLSPMKVFEYMACGKPILSSNLPVLQEVLNAHNAILLPPGETESWAQALEALKRDPGRGKDLGEQARTDVHEYTWEKRAGVILGGLQSPE